MTTTLIIVRYPKYLSFFGILSMALFRLPLSLNKKIGFYKLMGCGKNGTFDKSPDWRQWALLAVGKEMTVDRSTQKNIQLPSFINAYWKFFHCEQWAIFLEPIEGHGTWDHQNCFGMLPKQSDYDGRIAILTRATIRFNRLKNFWKHVEGVANQMSRSNGFITSIGIGEIPLIKQATFSIWKNKSDMKAFAYQIKAHQEVIQKTRKENWYSEEMFVRFKIIDSTGTIRGIDPLKR